MKAKSWIYFSILVAWLSTCILLFCFGLLDIVGIIVSFVFAIPTMIYDLLVTAKGIKRKKQLQAISKICNFEKYERAVIADCAQVNNHRIRAGVIHTMGKADPNGIINQELDRSKNFYMDYLTNLFGKKEAENKFDELKNNKQNFFTDFQNEIIRINPTEDELRIFDINLDDTIKRKLFVKQNKDKINETKV